MKIELVIFDLDGTIVDTERLFWNIWKEVGKEENVIVTDEILRNLTGSSREYEEVYLSKHDMLRIRETVRNRVHGIIDNNVKNNVDITRFGFYDLFSYLHEQGIKTAIASNSKTDHIEKIRSTIKNGDRFNLVVSSDDVTLGKPDPEMFIKVANTLNIKPENTLVLEDSVAGLTAAYRANMSCIFLKDLVEVTPQVEEMALHIKNNFLEVKDFMESLVKF